MWKRFIFAAVAIVSIFLLTGFEGQQEIDDLRTRVTELEAEVAELRYELEQMRAILSAILELDAAEEDEEDAEGETSLVGAWDWVERVGAAETVMMAGVLELRADGGYSYIGVDYGAMGFRWSSENGVISYTFMGITTQWFRYEIIDDNTFLLEYVLVPGVTHTLRRAR